MTHAELVARAAAWLKVRCNIVITEIVGGNEEPDAIGWKSGQPILIECKATRADFRLDAKKWFRHKPENGLGRYRYYMTLPGLIKPEELPDKWGLLEVKNKRIFKTVESGNFETFNRDGEVGMLLSCLRRIGQAAPKGVSIRCYNYENKNKATLGILSDAL